MELGQNVQGQFHGFDPRGQGLDLHGQGKHRGLNCWNKPKVYFLIANTLVPSAA